MLNKLPLNNMLNYPYIPYPVCNITISSTAILAAIGILNSRYYREKIISFHQIRLAKSFDEDLQKFFYNNRFLDSDGQIIKKNYLLQGKTYIDGVKNLIHKFDTICKNIRASKINYNPGSLIIQIKNFIESSQSIRVEISNNTMFNKIFKETEIFYCTFINNQNSN